MQPVNRSKRVSQHAIPGSPMGRGVHGSRGDRPVVAGEPAEEESDHVHDAGVDSFPASDPPSWSPLRVGGPAPQLRFGLMPA